MKKTEVSPQTESKDFRYGVNGFPKAGGLYRMGDNGAIPANRFYRAWNAQFNGDEVTERGGQSALADTGASPVIGLYSSNNDWPDDPELVSGGNSGLIRWGKFTTGGTAPTNDLETETSWNSSDGLVAVDIGYDGSIAIDGNLHDLFIPDGLAGKGQPCGYGQFLRVYPGTPRNGYRFGQSPASFPFLSVCSAVRFGDNLVVAELDQATPASKIYYTPVCAPGTVGGTQNESYLAASWTAITDSGLTINETAAGTATTVMSGPILFVHAGYLYALYQRYNGTPKGLLRKWSGTGTTWSTVGTFPTLTARDNAGGDYYYYQNYGFGRSVVEFDGATYIAVAGLCTGASTSNNGIYNSVFILKFDGASLTEFYNYAVPAPKRATVVAGNATTNGFTYTWTGAVNTSYYNTYSPPSLFKAGGNLYLTFEAFAAVTAPANAYKVGVCVHFSNATGTLTYAGDTISTPGYIFVEGSTRPTHPIDTTAAGFTTTYPDWHVNPWMAVVRVGDTLYGTTSNPTAYISGMDLDKYGYQVPGTDHAVWIYHSLDGLAWYKYIRLCTSGTADNDFHYLSAAPALITPFVE